GKVSHKGAVYDGEQDAIIDQQLWDQIQHMLTERRNGDTPVRAPKLSLLAGRIVDGEGRKMTPSHTTKGGKRYRYYVTHPSEMINTGTQALRISAPELERIITDRLKHWLGNQRAMMALASLE